VQRLRQLLVDLHHIVVCLGEHGLGPALPGLGDAGDLATAGVLDVEVPGAPVLAVERADLLPSGLECETNLAHHVLLHDLAQLLTVPALDDDAGLHQLARPCQCEHDLAAGVQVLARDNDEVSDETLLGSWEAALPGFPTLGAALLDRYDEPTRRYHDRRHLAEVLAGVQLLGDHAADVVAVQLAAWFHDAVYEVDRTDNEEQSARLAAEQLASAAVHPGVIAEVGRLVRLTATHRPHEQDTNGAVLCDADLAVLASDPRRYAEYTADVRAEYAALDDATFGSGRAGVLRQLLGLPSLFGTPEGQRHWEEAARRNLRRELAALTA